MTRWLGIVVATLRSCLRTHGELALENLALRQQLAVEGPRAAPAVDSDGPTVLGLPSEGVDEVAAFAARCAAGDGRPMASAEISTLLGVEESAPIGSAHQNSEI
jgi:hypothetical protein